MGADLTRWGDGGRYSQPKFVCPRCGTVSYLPEDIEHGYCGKCHDWTGDSCEYSPATPTTKKADQQTEVAAGTPTPTGTDVPRRLHPDT